MIYIYIYIIFFYVILIMILKRFNQFPLLEILAVSLQYMNNLFNNYIYTTALTNYGASDAIRTLP